MRGYLPLFACGLLLAETGTPSRLAAGLDSIRASQLRSSVAYLASVELQGRLSLRLGSESAARWVAAQFKAAGLKPMAPDFLQPVPLIEYRIDRSASSVTINRDGSSVKSTYPKSYSSFPSNVAVSGSVVFSGFGITAPELDYDDYSGIDARGKIVLVFDHEPQENDPSSRFNGKGSTRYAGAYLKTRNAQLHGATAVLLAGEPGRTHLSNQERLARVRSAGQRERMPLEALETSEIKIPLFTISDSIADQLLGGRAKELQSRIDQTLQPVSMDLPGFSVELQNVIAERRAASTWNVLGLVEGSDPLLSAETIVFSAHYDHDGPAPDGSYYPGADDDASGTAGVIALARAFSENKVKPKRSLLFAVFGAEERGLLGSYHYVSHPARPLETTRAVINFDMIGRNETASEQTKGLVTISPDTAKELNLIGSNYSPQYKAIVERANQGIGLKLSYKWDEEPALNIFFRSDHYPFALHDIPALWWFTGFHPDYHQTGDTARKINYGKMEKIVRLAFIAGFDLGDTEAPPQFQH
jgi:hypothetical protein